MDAADLRRAALYTDDALQEESVCPRAGQNAGEGRMGNDEERGVLGDVRRDLSM